MENFPCGMRISGAERNRTISGDWRREEDGTELGSKNATTIISTNGQWSTHYDETHKLFARHRIRNRSSLTQSTADCVGRARICWLDGIQ